MYVALPWGAIAYLRQSIFSTYSNPFTTVWRTPMATFNVTTTNDIIDANDGVLSLREAIAAAGSLPGRDTILLPDSGTITLNSSLPTLRTGNDLTIQSSSRFSTISGNNQHQLFAIDGANVTFENLTLAQGLALGGNGVNGGGGGGGFGGALFINNGSVVVDNVTFLNNRAIGGNGTFGSRGGRGGNDASSGQNGGDRGSGGAFNANAGKLIAGGGVILGGNPGQGGRPFPNGDSQGQAGQPGGNITFFGSGGGSGGAGGGGAGGGGAFESAGNGGRGGFGSAGGFGGGGGAGGGAGGGGANVLGGQTGSGNLGGVGALGGPLGGRGSNGQNGRSGESTFSGNSPGNGGFGGQGGGGAGLGGAIFVRTNADLDISNSRFEGNTATGGSGFGPGQGVGGAIFVQAPVLVSELGGVVRQRNLTFVNNSASSTADNTFGDLADLPLTPIGQNNPLASITVGAFSVPTFVDENADGDLDLFIGASDGTIGIARNEGTVLNPSFSALIAIRDLGTRSTPTFVDIDGDGDQDLFAGDTFGRIHYYRNRGSVSGASFAPPIINPFGISGGGGLANPAFADIDGDGDQDLFVGTADGTILFYRNTGTRTSPSFVRGANNPFGLQPAVGAAAPHFADVGNDGDFDVVIGAADGTTRFFENIGTPTDPRFVESSLIRLPDVGTNATPVLADINGDGFLDAFIGNQNGVVNFVNGVARGGSYPVPVYRGEDDVVLGGFGGVGRGSNPSPETRASVDELHFFGEGLTAENLLLTQHGDDLEIRFDGVNDTQVILRGFALEDLDNLPTGIGNILFDGDETIQDSFDVFNADSTQSRIWNRNSVTFLNDLDNLVLGFNDSDDVINGQGGDDIILGLSGDDVLRGGAGDDILDGGLGSDVKTGGPGADTFRFGADLIASGGGDGDVITDFEAIDRIDFSGFLGAGGEFSLAVLSDRLVANLSTGDTVTVLGDLTTAAAQLVPLATDVAIA